MFDRSWPCLNDQLVVMYDQVVTEKTRCSIIPVKVNEKECYLLVLFDVATGEARVRGVPPLKDGDVIVPVYTMHYDDENGESMETTFDSDPITVGSEELTITCQSIINDDDDETTYFYCFCLEDAK